MHTRWNDAATKFYLAQNREAIERRALAGNGSNVSNAITGFNESQQNANGNDTGYQQADWQTNPNQQDTNFSNNNSMTTMISNNGVLDNSNNTANNSIMGNRLNPHDPASAQTTVMSQTQVADPTQYSQDPEIKSEAGDMLALAQLCSDIASFEQPATGDTDLQESETNDNPTISAGHMAPALVGAYVGAQPTHNPNIPHLPTNPHQRDIGRRYSDTRPKTP